MADYFIDKTATGLNNGGPGNDAWQSIQKMLTNSGFLSSGDSVSIAIDTGPYESISHISAGKMSVEMSDISFDSATNQIRSTTTDFTVVLSAVIAGDILRVFGSSLNDKQVTVLTITANVITVIASNTIADETAGNEVNLVLVEFIQQCSALQINRNGIDADDIVFNGNFNKVCPGYIIAANDPRFLWNASTTSGEWYLTMADGSNPSLITNAIWCAVINGYYTHPTAADPLRQTGTVGSLLFDNQPGIGDLDGLGFDTLYCKSTINPNTFESMIPQTKQTQVLPDRYWTYNNFYWYGGMEANVVMTGQPWDVTFNSCIVAFSDFWGFRTRVPLTQYHTFNNCLSFWAGHRGIDRTGTSRGTTNIYGHLDVKGHLGFRFLEGGAGVNVGTINVYNSISYKNESAAIGFEIRPGDVTFNEAGNLWYPDMVYTGWIAYLSGDNLGWTTTDATDIPPSTATLTDPGTLTDPLLNIDLNDIDALVNIIRTPSLSLYMNGSPCIGAGQKWWGNNPRPAASNGEPRPDTKSDIGLEQTTLDPNHPANL